MFFGLRRTKPWSITHSWREECFCSISFSVMQRSYELFTIVISPYIYIRSGGAWIVSASVLPGFYYRVSHWCCCPCVLKRWSVACVPAASVFDSDALTFYVFSEKKPQVVHGWLPSSLWLMKSIPPLFFFWNPLPHTVLSSAVHKVLTQHPAGTSCLFCLHFLFSLGSAESFCPTVLVIDRVSKCNLGFLCVVLY